MSNKIIEELLKERKNHIVFHVPPGASEFDAWLRTALTKAYEAGQVDTMKKVRMEGRWHWKAPLTELADWEASVKSNNT